MNILVAGGAGYIGSHMIRRLKREKHEVTVLDNLSTGFHELAANFELVVADINSAGDLDKLFAQKRFDAVIHFASLTQVAESISHPAMYYANNVAGSLCLLDCMVRHNVLKLVFSSTAAVYGLPEKVPVSENHPTNPINPYGKSKLMVETIIEDFKRAYGLKAVILRYFNAAGASPEGGVGEMHEPETHLIPLLLQVASGRRANVTIFGTDYDTLDGTCIRDYIHVEDIVAAHLLALEFINEKNQGETFNLGSGSGFSVNEVLRNAEAVSGNSIRVEFGPRRQGDPAVLIADASKAKSMLQWDPIHEDIRTMISHAWNWEVSRYGKS